MACLVGAGCGGGSSSAPTDPPGVVLKAHGNSALDQGQTLNVTSSTPVTWSLQTQNGSKPPGSLTTMTSQSATYTAPDSVTKATKVTIIGTSMTDATQTGALQVTIYPMPVVTTQQLSVAIANKFYKFTVQSSGGAPPLTWQVSSGKLPNGLSLTPHPGDDTQIDIQGVATTSGFYDLTLELTDSSKTSGMQAYTMEVDPTPLSVVVPTFPSGSQGIPYVPLAFTATGGVPPYTWSLAAGSNFPPGMTLSSNGVLGGTPTQSNFDAYSFTLSVTDSQTPIKAIGFKGMSLLINNPDTSCSTGAEGGLSSAAPYAFLLRGFDAGGPVAIAGNFTVDGAGQITGGTEDIIRRSGVQTSLSIQPSGSTYTLGLDNRGCITLLNSAGTTTTFRYAAALQDQGIFTGGSLIEFDDSTGSGTRASGMIQLQDPTAFSKDAIAGMHAFAVGGFDAVGGRFAMAGSLNASGGTLSSVAADTDDAGALGVQLIGGSGTYNVTSSGRGTLSFTVGGSSFDFAIYPVSSAEALWISTNPIDGTHPLASGQSRGTFGPFGQQGLMGNHIFYMNGLSSNAPDATIGALNFDGNTSFKGTLFENNGGVVTSSSVSGTYGVDPNTGRTMFTGNFGNHPLLIYMARVNSGATGLVLGADAAAGSGLMLLQTPNVPTFGTSSVFGNYVMVTDENLDAFTQNFVALVHAPGIGSFDGFEDSSAPFSNGLNSNLILQGSDSFKTSGTGSFGGNTSAVTNGKTVFFVDNSPLNTHPTVNIVTSALIPVSLSPKSLTFGPQQVGTSSAPQTVTLINNQNADLNITNIFSTILDFTAVPGGASPCGATVPALGTCTFTVTFTPTTQGIIHGQVTVQDDALGSPQIMALTGTGQ